MNEKCIYNAQIVLSNNIVSGYVAIRNARIEAVCEGEFDEKKYRKYEKLDAGGKYLLPGIIDIHSSVISNGFKNGVMGDETSRRLYISEVERNHALYGVTTLYHALPFESLRQDAVHQKDGGLTGEINLRRKRRHMVKHRINLEYDLSNREELYKVIELIQSGSIHMVSFLQKPNILFDLILAERFLSKRQRGEQINLSHVLQHSHASSVGIAVHMENGSYEMQAVSCNRQLVCGTDNSIHFTDELFELESAHDCLKRVSTHGIREIKQAGNRILYSGDDRNALVSSIFQIGKKLNSLQTAAAMVTANPAKALGLDRHLGSIEPGKIADMVMVEIYDGIPVVRETWLNGRRVISCDYFE